MLRLTCANKTIALTLLVYRTPHLTQLVHHLLALHLLTTHRPMVALAATARSLSDPGLGSLISLFFLIKHITSTLAAIFDGNERLGPAPVPESLFYKSRIEALSFYVFFDFVDAFVFRVGCFVDFEGMFLSEDMFFPSDLVVGFPDILIDEGLLFF